MEALWALTGSWDGGCARTFYAAQRMGNCQALAVAAHQDRTTVWLTAGTVPICEVNGRRRTRHRPREQCRRALIHVAKRCV